MAVASDPAGPAFEIVFGIAHVQNSNKVRKSIKHVPVNAYLAAQLICTYMYLLPARHVLIAII